MSDPVSVISMALKILAERVLVLLALGMTFGLFCWALWAGTNISLITSAVFALGVFLPVLFRGSQNGSKDG